MFRFPVDWVSHMRRVVHAFVLSTSFRDNPNLEHVIVPFTKFRLLAELRESMILAMCLLNNGE